MVRSTFIFLALFFLSFPGWAESVPSIRPSITSQVALAHDLGPRWEEVKRSQVSMVLELFHIYQDHEVYFLARDAELLFDTAVLLAEEFPQRKSKIHLLNVSRLSVTSSHLESYLAQEGLSHQALQQGKKFLLVDTGFAGTISQGIQGLFAESHRKQILTHLISSDHPQIPSSRVFHQSPDTKALDDGVAYLEGLSPYTNTAEDYRRLNGKWVPISFSRPVDDDAPPAPEVARKYQQDLLYSFRSGQFQEQISKESELWRSLLSIYYTDLAEKEKVSRLKEFLSTPEDKELREAMVRDMTEVSLLTRPSLPFVSNTDLGLPLHFSDPLTRIEMIDAHPKYKKVFAFPEREIPKLFEAEDYRSLKDLIFNIDYPGISPHIGKGLATYSENSGVQTLILEMFQQGLQSGFVLDLMLYTLPHPGVYNWDVYVRRILEGGGESMVQPLIRYVFSQPGHEDFSRFIDVILDGASQPTLTALAMYVFSSPHSAGMEPQLYDLITRANEGTLKILGEYVFSKEHGQAMTSAFSAYLEKTGGSPSSPPRCEDLLRSS